MRKIPVFCDDGDCGTCGKDICCWNDCDKAETCDKKCSNVKYLIGIYASDDNLIKELDKLADREDNWLIGVAAERIEELLEQIKRLEAVVEAARKVSELFYTWDAISKYHPAVDDLDKALAALDDKV